MDGTKIEWTDATWNPLRGCSRVSEGCRNCYAERVAARFSGTVVKEDSEGKFRDPLPYTGLAAMTPKGPRWTGKLSLVEEHLKDPLRWKRPRRIFVNSMSDLFHESAPDSWLDSIFRVMIEAKHHTFQVLTKRPERMFKYMDDRWDSKKYPAPANVWLGVSVENQEAFKARVPLLIRTPAAVRWISAEPLLGNIELHDGLWRTTRDHTDEYDSVPLPTRLDWVVIGGESGPGARPFDIDWAYEMMGECEEAGVPVFMKQLGAVPVTGNANRWDFADHVRLVEHGNRPEVAGARVVLRDRKGGDMAEWPEEMRVRQFPRQAVPA